MIIRKNPPPALKKPKKIFGIVAPKRKMGRPTTVIPIQKAMYGKRKKGRKAPHPPILKPDNKALRTTPVDLAVEAKISERRRNVFDLIKRSYSRREVAETLGLTMKIVCDDVNAELFALRKSTVNDAESVRMVELSRLDLIQKDLLPLCLNHLVPDPAEPRKMVMVGPDHKKVETLLKIMERRAKYLGIDMPDTRIQLNIPWEKLTLDQAARIAAGADLKVILDEVENQHRMLPEHTDHIIDAEVVETTDDA